MKITRIITAAFIAASLTACNIGQDLVGLAAPKADKLVGTYEVKRLEWGSLAFNYPGKTSFRNNAAVPSATMLSMQVKIEKYSDELIGISTPSEFEFGGSPTFSADPKSFKTLTLGYEADRTNLIDGKETIGFIKNNVLTLDYQKDNARYLMTANKL
jgi:hypothetical protein